MAFSKILFSIVTGLATIHLNRNMACKALWMCNDCPEPIDPFRCS